MLPVVDSWGEVESWAMRQAAAVLSSSFVLSIHCDPFTVMRFELTWVQADVWDQGNSSSGSSSGSTAHLITVTLQSLVADPLHVHAPTMPTIAHKQVIAGVVGN